MYVRVTLDIKISYEEANFIRETFIDKYKLRELQLIPEQIEQAQALASECVRKKFLGC